MNTLKKYKNIIIVALVIVIAFIGYSFFFGPDVSDDDLVSQNVSPGANVVGSDIIQVLTELRSITLDDSVFSGPTFNALQDFSFEIVPKPTGRQNPFAPIGAIEDFQDNSTPEEDQVPEPPEENQ